MVEWRCCNKISSASHMCPPLLSQPKKSVLEGYTSFLCVFGIFVTTMTSELPSKNSNKPPCSWKLQILHRRGQVSLELPSVTALSSRIATLLCDHVTFPEYLRNDTYIFQIRENLDKSIVALHFLNVWPRLILLYCITAFSPIYTGLKEQFILPSHLLPRQAIFNLQLIMPVGICERQERKIASCLFF